MRRWLRLADEAMRKRLNAWMPQGSFLRNVSILTGGTVFSQGLMVLALPVLTRLYSPEDFNLLAVYVSVLGLVTVVSCLRYNIAIPLPEEDADGMALLVISLLAAFCTSLLCALPVILAPEASAAILGQPGLQPYLWMVPLGVLIASAYNALQYWTSRKKRFGLVTRTRMTRAVGGVGTQLGFGFLFASPFGLIFGQMVYGGFGVFRLARDLFRSDRSIFASLSVQSIRRIVAEYIHFPTRSTPAAMFDAGYQFLPILIIAPVVGETELGIIFLVMRAMGLPVSLIGSSISQVYLASARDRLRDGELGRFTRHLMLRIFSAGAPFLLATTVILVFFSGWIFGTEYAYAGTTALWMTPWFILQLTCSPVSSIFIITNHQFAWLALQFVGLVVIVGGVFATTRLYPDYTVAVFVLSNFLFYILVTLSILYVTFQKSGE